MNPSSFKLITFDLDDTVWPCAPVIESAELAVMEWLGECAPKILETHDLSNLRARRRVLMRKRPKIAHDLGEVRRLSMALLLVDHGFERNVAQRMADQSMDVFMTHRNRVEPYLDVEPVLRQLRERYCLISITNGNADPEKTPLAGLFHHCITAAMAGAAKPNPAVFHLACSLADCAPGQCLHVGDEPELDIHAARDLGMEAVWVNRGGRVWPADLPPPVLEVRDLRQLADWIGERGYTGRERGETSDGV